ncbi:hypothetical protein [Desulfuromonas sp. AOP6]|uniref:hypothetical protein n=1 Tax=Desulfuromonas sp. AOP6 TaxID=1566351 RepID=UPI001270E21F|nr:hypothetical protein [Desulfuromonas sp. AOP6]BCA79076.1 hypothetical protein AOP6_0863 [Desulfuromonas sp. AOP6]
MKDWSGKELCFECAGKLGANINIGRKIKGRCHRCHSEQTLFKVTDMPVLPVAGEDVCEECGHPIGTHAASCRSSELKVLLNERQDLIRLLEDEGVYQPDEPLVEQLRRLLQRSGNVQRH